MQSGRAKRVIQSADNFAIAESSGNDADYTYVYDTKTGEPVRVKQEDLAYQLNKLIPRRRGEEIKTEWRRTDRGLVLVCTEGDAVHAFSQTPVQPAAASGDAQGLATSRGAKGRRRKRGARGRGRKAYASAA